MKHLSLVLFFFLVSTQLTYTVRAEDDTSNNIVHEFQGEVSVENWFFLEDALFDNQAGVHNVSGMIQPEYSIDYNYGEKLFKFSPFLRVDQNDPDRTHFDIREAYYQEVRGDFEWSIGIQKVFWGVNESRHLIDIINQTDLVENISFEEKLGQPMLKAKLYKEWGTLSAYFMPFFRERTFPGPNGRFNAGLDIDQYNPLFESDAEHFHPDWAVRYDKTIGSTDIGISHFMGTDREPTFQTRFRDGRIRLVPFYSTINQTSLDIQSAIGNWLLKMETMIQTGDEVEGTFWAYVSGFEYTFTAINNSVVDIGLLMEHMYDTRGDQALFGFQNDLFTGMRITLNDTQNTEMITGIIMDMEDAALFYSLEFKRRLTEHMSVSLESRLVLNVDEGTPLGSIRNDDYIMLELSWFF